MPGASFPWEFGVAKAWDSCWDRQGRWNGMNPGFPLKGNHPLDGLSRGHSISFAYRTSKESCLMCREQSLRASALYLSTPNRLHNTIKNNVVQRSLCHLILQFAAQGDTSVQAKAMFWTPQLLLRAHRCLKLHLLLDKPCTPPGIPERTPSST